MDSATVTFDRDKALASLPARPGIYRFVDAGGASLYVGKAINLRRRVSSYFRPQQSPRIALMLRRAVGVESTETESEAAALLLENNLIKELKPPYNILFRDDKSYPYVRLTGHAYPRLTFHRGAGAGKGELFGPFPSAASVRGSIRLLQKAFRLRTCADHVMAHRSRPCLLHQIDRCSAPCTGEISAEGYAESAARARRFLSGGADAVSDDMARRMEEASARQDYEEAAQFRDDLQILGSVRDRHMVDDLECSEADFLGIAVDQSGACVCVDMVRGGRGVGERHYFPENASERSEEEVLAAFVAQHYGLSAPPARVVVSVEVPSAEVARWCQRPHAKFITRPRGAHRERVHRAVESAQRALASRRAADACGAEQLRALCERLDLPVGGRVRIECFDVSHSMGEAATASCVVCVDGEMVPSLYRRFSVRSPGGDDCAAMHEVVHRRYARTVREGAELPSLVVVDGGAAQVSAAQAALEDTGANLPLVGMAKGAHRRPGAEDLLMPGREPLHLGPDDPALRLLVKIRDEAHRFAVTGHRARRDKKRRVSVLEEIEGVGPSRRRSLLARFGSIHGIRDASEAELARIEGIGAALAGKIREALK